eukprot:CAMPEP_0119546226 /NCGR_PEP_ID=MMETSP1352-20130426/734_1 /TAXON_ID=265584 /ORGANISM="Stauroneis constricta, Strain CCMP1120" /LENGTH=1119 /DNA_ID=CAMNT_0007590905 /DNA_START=217 /DNA_END=3576 /DNA_ORIENTATION=-
MAGMMMSERTTGDDTAVHTLSSDVEPLQVAKNFVDHFTLPVPSSTVRFRSRNAAARVFENKSNQFILEENYDPVHGKRTITVKRMVATTRSLQLLRAVYTSVGILWAGILLAFCLQVLLFLVLDMTVQSGQTSITGKINIGVLLGVLLAIIVLIDGFAATMTMATTYCSELWSGHYFMKEFVFFKKSDSTYNFVMAEWIFFAFFLGTPLTVLCITLMARMDDWWTVTSLFWFSSVTVFFAIFAYKLISYEIQAALSFVRNREAQLNRESIASHRDNANGNNSDDNDNDNDNNSSTYVTQNTKMPLLEVMKRCLLLRQVHAYSGRRMNTYLARSFFRSSEDSDDVRRAAIVESTRDSSHVNWWAQITTMPLLRTDVPGGLYLFEPLDPPIRLYKIDDVQDNRPFITKSTWGLERIFCRPTNSRYIAIIEGPGALTRTQIKSNMMCSVVGTFLILMLCISALIWLEVQIGVLVALIVIMLFGAWRSLKRLRQFAGIGKDFIALRTNVKKKQKEEENEAAAAATREPETAPAFEIALGDTVSDGGEDEGMECTPTSGKQDNNNDDDAEQGQGIDAVLSNDTANSKKTIDEILIEKTSDMSPKMEQLRQQQQQSVRFADDEEHIIANHTIEITEGAYRAPSGESRRQWEKARTAPSEGIFLVSEYMRITKVTERMCWILYVIECVMYFAYPLGTLIYLQNWAIAVLYLFVAIVSSARHYLNVAVAIEETGTMDLVNGVTEEERWANKSRLSDLVGKITQDKSKRLWARILWAFGLIFVGIFLTSVGRDSEATNDLQHTYLKDFYYPPAPTDMRYATCSIPEINEVFGKNSTIGDYIFLAGLAYNKPALVEDELISWFDGMTVRFEEEIVEEYRKRTGNGDSAANFKLITVEESKLAIVSIRGTQNSFDLLADSQLWSAAMLMQVLRALLPFGEIWTPILDDLAIMMNLLESSAVADVSFYRVITPFIKELKESGNYDHVQVTGHSLGGGLSIITGSQAKVPAVAVSGPNALISGRSFVPPIKREDLNRYTFNIIPDRDLVPRFDDVADNYQNIRCNAPLNDFIGCHDFTRALCEIATTCGSANRPVLCTCHQDYGHPKPLAMPGTTVTFEEACPAKDELNGAK